MTDPLLSVQLSWDKSAPEWDAFVARSPLGHLLQSSLWGQFKARYGWEIQRAAITENDEIVAGAQVLLRRTPLGGIAYMPRGPVVDAEQPQWVSLLLRAVQARMKRQGAVFLKMEPNFPEARWLSELRFRPAAQWIQPLASIIVDLTPDLDAIAAAQKPKTRYNIGLAARRGVEVRSASKDELGSFYALLQLTAARDRFRIRPLRYYRDFLDVAGQHAQLFLASYQGETLAGMIVVCFGSEAIYLYGASSDSQRQLMPNHLLQWEAMKWAKAQECARYDLWGIPPEATGGEEEPSASDQGGHGMWGVYRFKLGFGGRVVRYAGSYDYVCSPLKYFLWSRLVPRLVGTLRGLGT